MRYNPFDDPIGKKIFGSFGPMYNQWRSLGGIERNTGLSHQEVAGFIGQHSDFFIHSPISPSGIELYRPHLDLLKI